MLDFIKSDISKANIQLCFACSDEEQGPEFELVSISKNVASEFRSLVRDWKRRYNGVETGDISLSKYDPQAVLRSHELEWLSLERHPEIKEQFEALADLTELYEFSADDDFINRLRFCAVILKQRDQPTAYFFRFYTKSKELSRSKRFGIFLKDGQYDKLTETTFLFDAYFDCLVLGDDLFISNKDGFHKIFRFYEMLKETARETLDLIEQHVPIANFSEFRTACMGHLQKVSKLKNIAGKPYLDKLTMGDLKAVINKYDLPIATVGKGTSEKLEFSQDDRWAILKLLDDDYLESIMTGQSYEANSKRQLSE
ncbi:MAG: DUF4868 domain-containing protein [Calditrichaeota bacterium]|nr:DUF4868 domain-containing protein [Calditrichota bacterium]